MLAQRGHAAELVAVCDPSLLEQAAQRLGLPLRVAPFDPDTPAAAQHAGEIRCLSVPLHAPAVPGRLDPANAPPDLSSGDSADMPPGMAAELKRLGLL